MSQEQQPRLTPAAAAACAADTYEAAPFSVEFCRAAAVHLKCAEQHAEQIRFLLWTASQGQDEMTRRGAAIELSRVSDALAAYLSNVNGTLSLRIGDETISPETAITQYNNKIAEALQ